MKKKPLFIVLTDTHLDKDNGQQVIDIFRQAIARAKEWGLKVIYHAGDFFDNRKGQPLSTLKAAITIFRMFDEEGIELRIIPGNHDKANYESEDSYLDVFEKYDNVYVIKQHGCFREGNVAIHMVPFFKESTTYPKYLEQAQKDIREGSDNILITHVATNGVRNNDGSKMEGVVGLKQFTEFFDLTIQGHYHNYQELAGGDIVYIGSSHQHNFGEDPDKGLTLVYEDLSIEQVRFNTKEYKQVDIDLNTASDEEVKGLIEKYENSDNNIRFKLHGSEEKLKSIDKKKFNSVGIDIKTKPDEIDVDVSYAELRDFKSFDPESIVEEWKNFSDKKQISEEHREKGLERLVNLLIKK